MLLGAYFLHLNIKPCTILSIKFLKLFLGELTLIHLEPYKEECFIGGKRWEDAYESSYKLIHAKKKHEVLISRLWFTFSTF